MPTPILLDAGPSPRGWHRLQLFLECPQRFAFRHRDGEKVRDDSHPSPPLATGSLIHVGLAHHYARMQARQQGRDPDAYYEPTDAVAALVTAKGEGWAPFMATAQHAVEAYIAQYLSEKRTILHVEEVFEADFGGNLLTARVDLVFEDARGKVWFEDHKTTGRIDAKQPLFYAVSGQVLAYRWIGQAVYGERFGGVSLNMVQTDGTKFARPGLDPAPALMARFPRVVVETEARIAALDAEGRACEDWPRSPTELVCYHRYGACDFIERCKWGA